MTQHESWLLLGGAGLLGLFLLTQVVQYPKKILWTLTKSAVFGVLFVVAVNWVGGYFNFHLPFNPATALTAGFLGIPGVLALVTLHLWVFPS